MKLFHALLLSSSLAISSLFADETQPEQIVWDLSSLFDTVEDWESALNKVETEMPALANYEGKLGDSAQSLLSALKLQSNLFRQLVHVYAYAALNADEDIRESEPQARKQRVLTTYNNLIQASSWMEPEIVSIGSKVIEGFIADEPALEPFDFSLRNSLRMEAHTLTPEAERVMAAASQLTSQPSSTYSILANADVDWPTVTLSNGTEAFLNQAGYTKHRAAQNRLDRKLVFDAFWGTFQKYKRTMGQTLLSEVQANVFQSRMRNYENILDWALADDNLPEDVYRSLVKVTNESLPSLHRYFKLRGRMLGVEDLSYYDIYPELVTSDMSFSYQDSIDLSIESTQILGEDYNTKLATYSQSGHVHVYPSKGKRSGAYMSGFAYDVDPYMLLNHNDDYNSMSTYAHEIGHALHTILSKENQPFEKASYSTFVAETAAIANELLVHDLLLEQADSDEEKLFILGNALEQLRGTFFRQTMFAEFELAIHEEVEQGHPLTGDRLTEIYGDLLRRYHGHDEGVLNIDEAYCVEWAYIPHFYYDFYVYQYSTSISAAAYFVEQIKTGGEAALEKYLAVLKAGGSDYPHDIFMKAGLDMTQEAPYRALIRRMDEIMDQIEAILDKDPIRYSGEASS